MPLDLARFTSFAAAAAGRFAAAVPFPHVVIDDFLPGAAAHALAAEAAAPDLPWKAYRHVNERKRVASDVARLGPVTREVIATLQGPVFREALGALAGVGPLVPDPDLDGSGLHETEAGGWLNLHVDHLTHTKRRQWSRQLNLLLFLTPGWREEWGGHLELWTTDARRCAVRLLPRFNRCVVFRTTEGSFHGVPEGVSCPPGQARRSLALYYFRDESRPCPLTPTRYVARPSDPPLRRALIRADVWLLRAYSAAKRYTPLSDAMVTRLLRWL